MLAQWGSYVKSKGIGCGRNGARGGAGPSFRRSSCGFARILLRFDAPAVVSRGLFRPLLGGPLSSGPQRRTRWGEAFVSTLPLWADWPYMTFTQCGKTKCNQLADLLHALKRNIGDVVQDLMQRWSLACCSDPRIVCASSPSTSRAVEIFLPVTP